MPRERSEIKILNKQRPIIGISVGDPSGIGPEITAKSLSNQEIYDICRPLVVSDFELMQEAVKIALAQTVSLRSLELNRVENPKEGKYEFGTIDVLDMRNVDMSKHAYKKVASAGGKASFEYIKKVIDLAMAGDIDATVTGPIHKESINLAGYHYSGHTEIYADFTNTKDYAMMLVHDNFRIVHVSTHVSLREACDLVKKERILKVIKLGHATLIRLGVENPRIAVVGLNPHAGEGGLFGDEEMEEIIPAIDAAKKENINVEGPFPPDTIFSRVRGGLYDLAVAMYHDQGHIAMKITGFTYDAETNQWNTVAGVNMTLGLPIIRTSVDHGVAFGKAGEGRANPQSMLEAIKIAAQLC